MVWSISESLAPSNAERAALSANARTLLTFVERNPSNDAASLKATSIVLLGMIKSLSGPKLDDLAAESLVEAYLDALDDVPSWCVAEAVRRWNRGECGKGRDYKWRPSPAELREVATEEEWKIKGRAVRLLALASSVPEKEYSAEYRADMVERIRRLFHALFGREDPIDRMRRVAREEAEAQLAKDRARALAEIEAAEKGTA